MSAYMKNRFRFFGIPKPQLKAVVKPFLAAHKKEPLCWDMLFALWNDEHREAQYAALLYLESHKRELRPEHLAQLRRLITEKSWWDTVDSLDAYVGMLVLAQPQMKEQMLLWAQDENLWLRRVAINFQQRFKEQTDRAIFEEILEKNLGSEEYFINKAIGWSLREYGKTDPDWVGRFIDIHRETLHPLSVREAEKCGKH